MPSKILQEVADYCWSKNFLGENFLTALHESDVMKYLTFLKPLLLLIDVFRNFFTEHGAVFEDAPALLGGEHNMKYYSLFQVYLKLYEVGLRLTFHSLSSPFIALYLFEHSDYIGNVPSNVGCDNRGILPRRTGCAGRSDDRRLHANVYWLPAGICRLRVVLQSDVQRRREARVSPEAHIQCEETVFQFFVDRRRLQSRRQGQSNALWSERSEARGTRNRCTQRCQVQPQVENCFLRFISFLLLNKSVLVACNCGAFRVVGGHLFG